MRAIAILVAVFCTIGASATRADPTIASVQQMLKDQGFYYGEITGTKDSDTTAAIRRYQIRNGLQISGDLNADTRKSLGLKGTPPAAPLGPAPTPRSQPPDSRDASPPRTQQPTIQDDAVIDPRQPPSGDGYSPTPPSQSAGALFRGTPYARASAESQRRVVLETQIALARRGYYRDGIDGVYGPGTEFAVRAYQSRFGIAPSGRLDMETLAVLGLLPGQSTPGVTAPTRRVIPRPRFIPPGGEPIYIPR